MTFDKSWHIVMSSKSRDIARTFCRIFLHFLSLSPVLPHTSSIEIKVLRFFPLSYLFGFREAWKKEDARKINKTKCEPSCLTFSVCLCFRLVFVVHTWNLVCVKSVKDGVNSFKIYHNHSWMCAKNGKKMAKRSVRDTFRSEINRCVICTSKLLAATMYVQAIFPRRGNHAYNFTRALSDKTASKY